MTAISCDVVVVGSGAGGLSAALAAADAGLDVVVIEKDSLFGGTTAHSEGMIWIPKNRKAEAQGKSDDPVAALTYLRAIAGNQLDEAKAAAYVERAAEALDFIEANSRIRYALAGSLDYYSRLPGATVGTRSLRVEAMDGKTLGSLFDEIRPPLRSTLAFGGMTITAADLPSALKAHRSVQAFLHMAKLALGYGIDRARGYSRGTRISHGHALVACLVEALRTKGARLFTSTALGSLIVDNGRVTGAHADSRSGSVTIEARRGVVLAAGGFSNGAAMQARFYPTRQSATDKALLASPASTGDGLAAGETAGGMISSDVSQAAAWTPASLVPQADGSTIAFPHYIDRNKPGFIAVDATGRRFANEALVYQDFVAAMIEHCRAKPATECWLIADARAVDRYGIGAAPPFPALLGRFVKSGYLTKANSLVSLASKIGLPADALASTVERFNAFARAGKDPDFGRGESAYERACGDAAVSPNPSLGPLEVSPFYAVRL
ncbi:MAG: FAD-dependent oxidoreductase, partial [Labrys sp. (in: a-proteobacteria)]